LARDGYELNEANIEKALDIVLEQREAITDRPVFSASRKVINICHAEPRFDPAAMESLERSSGVENPASFKGSADKQAALQAVRASRGPLTIYWSGHGGKQHLWLDAGQPGEEESNNMSDPAAISYQELGDALAERGGLGDVVILVHACYSYNFCSNLLAYLAGKGVTQLPLVVTSSNYDRLSYGDYFLKSLTAQAIQDKPLTMQGVFAAEKAGFSMQDMGVFAPVDPELVSKKLGQPQYAPEAQPGPSGVAAIPRSVLELGVSERATTLRLPAGVLDIGFEGGVATVSVDEFNPVWNQGRSVAIPETLLVVLHDPRMGAGFGNLEVRLVSQQQMNAIPEAAGKHVIRLGNRVLAVDSYWNEANESKKLDILMHEAMAEWMQRRRPRIKAEDTAVDLESKTLPDTAARRQAHMGVAVDQAMEGDSPNEQITRALTTLTTPGLGSSAYVAAANALRAIALNTTDIALAQQAVTALETPLKTPGLDPFAYEATANALRAIALNTTDKALAQQAVTALETPLRTPGLDSFAYTAAANALRAIAERRSELITSTTVTALETPLTTPGPYSYAYAAAADALRVIAWRRSELITSTTVTALETPLRTPGLDSYAYAAATDALRVIALNTTDIALAQQAVTALETPLTTPGPYSYAYTAAANALRAIAEQRSELITSTTVTALETPLTTPGP
jgi:hypothetical protein